jgi:hypothetical protein
MGNTRLRHRPYRPVTPTSEASRAGRPDGRADPRVRPTDGLPAEDGPGLRGKQMTDAARPLGFGRLPGDPPGQPAEAAAGSGVDHRVRGRGSSWPST